MDGGLEGSTSNKGTSKWSVNMWKKYSTSLLNRVIQIENTTKCTHNHTGSLKKKKKTAMNTLIRTQHWWECKLVPRLWETGKTKHVG